MTAVHLLHGFNVSDGGRSTTDKLKPYLRRAAFAVFEHDYGLFGLLQVRVMNSGVAERVRETVMPGDIGIGHSNGCAILAAAADRGAPFDGLVYIAPALDAHRAIAPQVKWLHVYHNYYDFTVRLAKLFRFLAWGDMGARGYTGGDARAMNVDMTPELPIDRNPDASEEHSRFFRQIDAWAPQMLRAIAREQAASAAMS